MKIFVSKIYFLYLYCHMCGFDVAKCLELELSLK